MRNFKEERLQQILTEMTDDQLKIAVNQGLEELKDLVTRKPKGWHDEIDVIGKTLETIKREMQKRGIWNEKE